MDTTLELPLSTTDAEPEAKTSAPARSPSRALRVFAAITALALGGGAYHHFAILGRESTDDAQTEGHIVNVAPRVSGQVAEVLVRDNQQVHAGDVLVRLDTSDLDARLAAARADVLTARATVEAAEAQLSLTRANSGAQLTSARGGLAQARAQLVGSASSVEDLDAAIAAARARRELADNDLQRALALQASGGVTAAEVDARQSTLTQAVAALAQARARRTQADSTIRAYRGVVSQAAGAVAQATTGPEQIAAAEAGVAQARARLAQAEASERLAALSVEHATVRAPIDGIVSRKTVEPGQMASPERPLLALVGTAEVWVVANFKEDQLAHLREGQPVRVEVDAFDGEEIQGTVESVAAATGSRFSLLPPDNASGNFTKVVQRVPVRIHVRAHGLRLVPGLNVVVTVDTRSSHS